MVSIAAQNLTEKFSEDQIKLSPENSTKYSHDTAWCQLSRTR